MKSSAKRSKLEIRSRIRWSSFGTFHRIFAVFAASQLHGRNVLGELELVGPARMRTLNRTWRGKDAPTDVLSFESEIPRTGPVLLNPVFLCPDVAKRGQTPAERSLDYLFAHGLLHSLGWDHTDAAEEKRMDAGVRKVLNEAGVPITGPPLASRRSPIILGKKLSA